MQRLERSKLTIATKTKEYPGQMASASNLAELINDASIDGIMAVDRSFKVIAWNQTLTTMKGIAASDIIGRSLFDHFPKLNVDSGFKQQLAKGFAGFKLFLPADEPTFIEGSFEHHLVPIKALGTEEVIAVVDIIHDVAHRVKAENALKELLTQVKASQSRLKEAERIGKMGSWERDLQKNELVWSDELYRLYGLEPGSVTPTSDYFIDELVHTDEKELVRSYIRQIYEGVVTSMEYRIIRKDGATRYIYAEAERLFNEKGELVLLRGVSRDTTEQKLAELKLQEASNAITKNNHELQLLNTELKTFANVAAHKIHEPLKQSYVILEQLAKTEAKTFTSQGKSGLRRAQSALQRMSLVTEDILTYLSINADAEKEIVALTEVVQSALATLSARYNIQESNIAIDDLAAIQGLKPLLGMLVMHLLDNALKFRPREHSLMVSITGAEVGCEKDATGVKPAGFYKLSFIDNGIGFRQEDAELVFEVFERVCDKSRYRGSGMGLAICRKIMQLHGGFIEASAKAGAGSRFDCYFPVDRV